MNNEVFIPLLEEGSVNFYEILIFYPLVFMILQELDQANPSR